jgi:hypothetical protein
MRPDGSAPGRPGPEVSFGASERRASPSDVALRRGIAQREGVEPGSGTRAVNGRPRADQPGRRAARGRGPARPPLARRDEKAGILAG